MNFEVRKTNAWFPSPHFMSYVTLNKLCGHFPILLPRLKRPTKVVTVKIKCENVSKLYLRVQQVVYSHNRHHMHYFFKVFSCLTFQFYKSFMSMLYSQNPLGIQKWVSHLWREILQLCEEPLKGSNFTDLVISRNLSWSNSRDLVKNLCTSIFFETLWQQNITQNTQ